MIIRKCLVLLLPAVAFAAGQTRPSTQPGTRPSDPLKSMSAEQVMEQMLQPTTRPSRALDSVSDKPVADRTSGRGAVKPDAPQVNIVREGTYVIDRLVRLTRGQKDQQEITFESDGKALRDPPMIILPNQKLMLMEDAVNASSRDLKFRVTGMVTEYRGRNYVLLEKVAVVYDGQQSF